MRLSCSNPIQVRSLKIGGPEFLVCLPLVARNTEELVSQAERLVDHAPDLVEWRADAFEEAADTASCLSALNKLRSVCMDIPIIFTFRSAVEGGMQEPSEADRLTAIEAAVTSGLIDLVDLEIIAGQPAIERIKKTAKSKRVFLILSHHDFNRTPPETEIINTLIHAQKLGADIAKIALMPQDQTDVLSLLSATCKARSGPVTIPQFAISMGKLGAISRICGGQFGSDITFAAHEIASAPGQIGVKELRQLMQLIY